MINLSRKLVVHSVELEGNRLSRFHRKTTHPLYPSSSFRRSVSHRTEELPTVARNLYPGNSDRNSNAHSAADLTPNFHGPNLEVTLLSRVWQ